MLIDTHAHLYWDSFKRDFEEVLKRCVESGVTTIINVGVDPNLSKKAVAQTIKQFNNLTIYSSIGIHPHEAVKYAGNNQETSRQRPASQGERTSPQAGYKIQIDLGKLEKVYLENPEKVIGVGECGLDFLFESNPDWVPNNLTIEQLKKLQKILFQAQIDLAKKLNLPLLVHCRDDRSKNPQNSECWDEVIEMTKDWRGIYHCYSGLSETTSSLLKTTNFLVSFAGNLTYPKNDYLKEAVKLIPLERIVLETDCPFLSPQSIRGKRNEPSSVREIAQVVAEIKNEPLEKVANQTTWNVKKLFNL